jgi:hypothetical protein
MHKRYLNLALHSSLKSKKGSAKKISTNDFNVLLSTVPYLLYTAQYMYNVHVLSSHLYYLFNVQQIVIC